METKMEKRSLWQMANEIWDTAWSLSWVQFLWLTLVMPIMLVAVLIHRAVVVPVSKLAVLTVRMLDEKRWMLFGLLGTYCMMVAVLFITGFLRGGKTPFVREVENIVIGLPLLAYWAVRLVMHGPGAMMWRDVRSAWRWLRAAKLRLACLVAALLIAVPLSRSPVGDAFGGTMREMVANIAPAWLVKMGMITLGQMAPVLCPEDDFELFSNIFDHNRIRGWELVESVNSWVLVDAVAIATFWCASGGMSGPLGELVREARAAEHRESGLEQLVP